MGVGTLVAGLSAVHATLAVTRLRKKASAKATLLPGNGERSATLRLSRLQRGLQERNVEDRSPLRRATPVDHGAARSAPSLPLRLATSAGRMERVGVRVGSGQRPYGGLMSRVRSYEMMVQCAPHAENDLSFKALSYEMMVRAAR